MILSISWIDRPDSITGFLKKKMTWFDHQEQMNYTCLAARISYIHTAYLAVERIRTEHDQREVFAMIAKLEYKRDRFRYVAASEDELTPKKFWCPIEILDLLSPTEDKSANAWRDMCRRNWEARKERKEKLQIGNTLVPIGEESVYVFGYGEIEEFLVTKRQPRTTVLRSNKGHTIKPYPWLLDQLEVKK